MSDSLDNVYDETQEDTEETKNVTSVREVEADSLDDLTDEDALDLLLAAEPPVVTLTAEIDPREGLPKGLKLRLRSLTEVEFDSIRKEAMAESGMNREDRRAKKRRGEEEEELDDNLYKRLIVVWGTSYPDWSDSRLLKKHNTVEAAAVVQKSLLLGEIYNLATKIIELSGFDEELINYAGN